MNKSIGRYRMLYQGTHNIPIWYGDWWTLYNPPEIDEPLNTHILENLENYCDILDIEVQYD